MYTVIIETEWEGESFTSMFIRSRKKKETDKEQGLQKCIFYIFQLVKDNPIPESRWTSRKIPWTNKAPLILRKREERKKKKTVYVFPSIHIPTEDFIFRGTQAKPHTKWHCIVSLLLQGGELERRKRREPRDSHSCAALPSPGLQAVDQNRKGFQPNAVTAMTSETCGRLISWNLEHLPT